MDVRLTRPMPQQHLQNSPLWPSACMAPATSCVLTLAVNTVTAMTKQPSWTQISLAHKLRDTAFDARSRKLLGSVTVRGREDARQRCGHQDFHQRSVEPSH